MIKYDPELEEYTDYEKILFDGFLVDNDYLGMFVYQQTVASTKFANLYHSFNKGSKGKYQMIVDDQLKRGKRQFEDYIVLLQEGHDVESEVSTEAFELIKEQA